jgi:hypothetical protein
MCVDSRVELLDVHYEVFASAIEYLAEHDGLTPVLILNETFSPVYLYSDEADWRWLQDELRRCSVSSKLIGKFRDGVRSTTVIEREIPTECAYRLVSFSELLKDAASR